MNILGRLCLYIMLNAILNVAIGVYTHSEINIELTRLIAFVSGVAMVWFGGEWGIGLDGAKQNVAAANVRAAIDDLDSMISDEGYVVRRARLVGVRDALLNALEDQDGCAR
jgi:hypothetical protein